jgi:hypothetical protein
MSEGKRHYVNSLGSVPTRYWPMMLPIFQQLGIDPSGTNLTLGALGGRRR